MSSSNTVYDVIILGGGPAGLQASLGLSRVRRPNLVISIPDVRRNIAADKMHSVLTLDGTPPSEFISTAKEEILRYGFASFENGKAVSAKKIDENFLVTLENGKSFTGRKLVFATGSRDIFPNIEGKFPDSQPFSKIIVKRVCNVLGNENCSLSILPWMGT